MANAPTILVKKSDGTFVRMSLSELKATKQGTGAKPAPAPKAASLAETPKPAPANPAAPAVKTQPLPPRPAPTVVDRPTPPVKPAAPQIPRAAKPPVTEKVSADFAAPLAEELPTIMNAGPKVSTSRAEQVDAIIKKLSFTPAVHSLNRLRTIVQLYLKDVRTSAQTKDALTRSELDGGMGLTEKQASEVLEKCQTKQSVVEKTEAVRPLKQRPMPAPKEEVRPESLPATSTPNNAFRHAPIKPVAPMPKPVSAPAPLQSAAPVFKLSPATATKPMMHDVVAKPIAVTPVDEVRAFNLTDFRRLAADPAEAARRLRQKFTNLKDESIVLYLQGLSAWRASPLYLEYLHTVLSSLVSGQKLPSPRDKKLLQFNELTALVAMEQTMDYL